MKRESDGGWTIDRVCFLDLPVSLQRRCIRNLFRQTDDQFRSPSLRTVDRIIRLASKGESDSSLDVKGGHVVVSDRHLRFVPLQARAISHAGQPHGSCQEFLSVPGELLWSGTGQRLQVQQQARSQLCAPLGKVGFWWMPIRCLSH